MARCGITEKRLNNRRFKKTEEMILKVFFEGECDSISRLAKRAGIARTTVYLHHHRIAGIPADYQRYILYMYKKSLKKWRDGETVEKIFEKTLVFIIRNKGYYSIALRSNNGAVYHKMVEALRPFIVKAVVLPKNSRRIYNVYAGEVVALLYEWGEKGFPEDKEKELLSNLLYVTKTFRSWLAPIMEN